MTPRIDVVNPVLPPTGRHTGRNGVNAESDAIPTARWRPRFNVLLGSIHNGDLTRAKLPSDAILK